jgi:type I restriction enzyme S subunit
MMRIDKVTDIETDEISYELPKGWIRITLSDISLIILGQSPPSSTYNEDGKGLPFYQGKLEFGDIYPTPQKWCVSPNKIAERGDVLISVRAPVGPTNICPERSCIGRGLAAIRGLDGIDMKFILYLLRCFEKELASQGTGTTFNAITGNLIRDFLISLPPLSEQHRIVAKIEELFTKLDAGIESLKKVQAQLKRYRQAVLKSAVEGKLTAEWRAIHKDELEPASVLLEKIKKEKNKDSKYAGSLIDDKQDKKTDLPDLPDGWVWTKLGTLFEWSNGKGLTQKEMTKGKFPVYGGNGINGSHTNFLSEKESIVIGRVGANCGNVHIAPEKSWITDNAIYSKWITDHLNIRFALYLLFNIGLNKLSGGSGQPYVAQAILNPVTIPLPPLVEQNKIVDEIESCLSIADKVEFIINAELKRAERLRQSILKQAFSGKLVPQDPNDEPASVLLDRIKQEKAKNDNQRKGQKSNDNTEQMKLL